MGRIGETTERHDPTRAPLSESPNAEHIRAAMNGTSPRQRWREIPLTPPADTEPIEVEEPKDNGASARKSLLVAGGFGFAALMIGLLSILLVDRDNNGPSSSEVFPAQVAGTIQTPPSQSQADVGSTTPSTSNSTVDSATNTTAASSVGSTIAPELADLGLQIGELELTVYVNDEVDGVVASATLSFAVRIFNPSEAEIPVNALDFEGTVAGVPVERITFLSQHATIPPDDSAVGTVRVVVPETDRPLAITVSVGGIELGRATIG